jgi:hypothetical protein
MLISPVYQSLVNIKSFQIVVLNAGKDYYHDAHSSTSTPSQITVDFGIGYGASQQLSTSLLKVAPPFHPTLSHQRIRESASFFNLSPSDALRTYV